MDFVRNYVSLQVFGLVSLELLFSLLFKCHFDDAFFLPVLCAFLRLQIALAVDDAV